MGKSKCIYCGKLLNDPYCYKDWNDNRVCVEHIDLVGRCSGCFSYFFRGGKVVEPNRCVCNYCLENEVNEANINTHIDYVYNCLYERGFNDIQRDHITIHLVSKQRMRELYPEGEALGLHSGYSIVFNEKGRKDFKQNIYILTHLHFVKFEATLAHELIHGWQLQQNIEDYNGYITEENRKARTEGFAQLGSYILFAERWKEAESCCTGANGIMRKEKALTLMRFSEGRMKVQNENTDPYYGECYRKIKKRVDDVGWTQIIREARLDQLKNYI